MENKHTPGPWKVKHSESKPAFNVIGTQLGQTYKIARCPYYTYETITEGNSHILERNMAEAEANAHLIAESPQLFKALEQIKDIAGDINISAATKARRVWEIADDAISLIKEFRPF